MYCEVNKSKYMVFNGLYIMKIIKVQFIFLFFCQFIFGQNENKYAGFIKIQDTLVIKYKIEFSESKGKISGFSYTDFGGEHETKSKISGIYDKDNRRLSFKEVALIYTKSPVSMDDYDFCNIHLEPTRFKLGSDKLIGDFKGKFNDGTECINGELAMNSIERIVKRVSKFTNKVQNSKRIEDSIKEKVQNLKILDTLNLNILKKSQITSIFSASQKLKIVIYDGGQEDGDIITILQDGNIILSKYKILNSNKILEIPLNRKKTTITIVANATGSIGSNTAVIEIVDNGNIIKALTNLESGEKTQIDILNSDFKL